MKSTAGMDSKEPSPALSDEMEDPTLVGDTVLPRADLLDDEEDPAFDKANSYDPTISSSPTLVGNSELPPEDAPDGVETTGRDGDVLEPLQKSGHDGGEENMDIDSDHPLAKATTLKDSRKLSLAPSAGGKPLKKSSDCDRGEEMMDVDSDHPLAEATAVEDLREPLLEGRKPSQKSSCQVGEEQMMDLSSDGQLAEATAVEDSREPLLVPSETRKLGQTISEDENGAMSAVEPQEPLQVSLESREDESVSNEGVVKMAVDGGGAALGGKGIGSKNLTRNSDSRSEVESEDGSEVELDDGGEVRSKVNGKETKAVTGANKSSQATGLTPLRRSSRLAPLSPVKTMPKIKDYKPRKSSAGKKKPTIANNLDEIFLEVRIQIYSLSIA
jgi:hypothetical protein